MRPAKLLLFLTAFTPGCDLALLGDEGAPFTYEENIQPPEELHDGLQVATLADERIDASGIHQIVASLQENRSMIVRGVLISRNNRLVHESYYHGWNRDRKQDLRSATKSMTSTLVGIAIDQGFIADVHQPVFDYFDEYDAYANWHECKPAITIQSFLQMRTRLKCNDDSEASPGYQGHMYPTDDWVKFVLDLPIARDCNQAFAYCTGAPVVLGALVHKATGQSFEAFAHERLWGPLGVTDYNWEYMPDGRVSAGGQIHMKPRDALKFGLLILNNGRWNGQQLVSEEWIRESTTSYGTTPSQGLGLEYGYLWWITTWTIGERELPSFFARGNGGQMIVVVPDMQAVIVLTGGLYGKNWVPSRLHLVSSILQEFEY